ERLDLFGDLKLSEECGKRKIAEIAQSRAFRDESAFFFIFPEAVFIIQIFDILGVKSYRIGNAGIDEIGDIAGRNDRFVLWLAGFWVAIGEEDLEIDATFFIMFSEEVGHRETPFLVHYIHYYYKPNRKKLKEISKKYFL
ncbi:hypothetical protein AAK706_12000, partial [Erysipelotrichaceae bacterium 66-17]